MPQDEQSAKRVHRGDVTLRFGLIVYPDDPKASAAAVDRATRIGERMMADPMVRSRILEMIRDEWPRFVGAETDRSDPDDPVAYAEMAEIGKTYRRALAEAHDDWERQRAAWQAQRDDILQSTPKGDTDG